LTDALFHFQDLRSYTIHGGKGALRCANTPYWRDTAKIVE